MIHRKLGRTELIVSEVGFGGIPIQRVSEEEAVNAVKAAVNAGVSFIDTARGYTDSERKIGKALKDFDRNKLVIATKGMVTTAQECREQMQKSFEELGIEIIDLYQIHNVGDMERLNKILGKGGAVEYIKEMQKKGKVRFIGITSHSAEIIEKALQYDVFDTIQFPYNIVEQQFSKCIKIAKQKNVGMIVMKPLAGGAFRNSAAAIKWVLNNPDISVVIPGMGNVKEAKQDAGVSGQGLTEEEAKLLEEEAKGIGKILCRRCGYCMPCPQGINIPMMFTLNRYYENYGMKDWAKNRYADMVKASACIECGQCEQKCPYKLPIRKEIKKVIKNLEKN